MPSGDRRLIRLAEGIATVANPSPILQLAVAGDCFTNPPVRRTCRELFSKRRPRSVIRLDLGFAGPGVATRAGRFCLRRPLTDMEGADADDFIEAEHGYQAAGIIAERLGLQAQLQEAFNNVGKG